MAEGFLKSFDPRMEVYSAGTVPAERVHPKAIKVMREVGIDLSGHLPKLVDEFLHMDFDYVITVCDHAREQCPVFTGRVYHQEHIGFEDPAEAAGTEEEIMGVFRKVRDEIRERLFRWYLDIKTLSNTNVGLSH
jgi:arsenate reductase